ncbi:MAG: hypothetical protein WD894_15710 [Pirellulales bacterium]
MPGSALRNLCRCPLSQRLAVFAALVAAACTSVALAQPNSLPVAQLTSIFPFGAKPGGTLEVALAGADLDELTGLHFSHPGITAKSKLAPSPIPGKPEQPVPNQFVVTVAGDVPRGLYEARAIGRFGISNPRFFLIDPRDAIRETEPNDDRAKAQEVPLETHLFGTVEAEKSDHFKFTAKQGQRILIQCWANRADSRLDATLVLFDAAGKELARNNDTYRRDPLIDFTAPADGLYTLQLYDFLYRGGNPEYAYRLTFSNAPLIDFVFPPAGLAGTKGTYSLYGRNLPGGTATDAKDIEGRPLEKLDVEIELPADAQARSRLPIYSSIEPQDAGMDAFVYRLSSPQGESNSAPIFYATAPVVLEQEPNSEPSQPQKVTPPCEVVGQFAPRGDRDYVSFDAKKGETYFVEVYSERLGLTCDPYLLVQRVTKNDQGEETAADVVELDDPKILPQDQRLQSNFDMSNGDMAYKLVVPEDGTYRLLVRDLYYQSRGCASYLYRLAIRRPTPDFRLLAVSEPPRNPQNNNQANLWSPLLQKGGTQALKVSVLRQDDFEDEIEVVVEGLPPGVTCLGMTIGPKVNNGVLVLSAAEDAAAWSGTIRIVGKAKINGADVAREARGGSLVWGSNDRNQQPIRARMTETIAIAVTDKETSPLKIELGAGKVFETSLAGKLQIPVKVTRRGDFKGNLKLNDVGSPREIRINDVDIAAGASEGSLALDVRNNLTPGTYTFVLQAATQFPNYRRNPEAAEEAERLAKELKKAAGDAANAAKQAADAKAAAEKAANEAAATAKQMTDALMSALKGQQEAETQLIAAIEAYAQIKPEAETKPDDQSLQTQKSERSKAVAQATEKLKETTEIKVKAEQAANEMSAKAQAASNAKQAAEAALNEANAKKTALDQQSSQAAQVAKQKAEAAKPKNVNVTLYSAPVTVKIAAAPLKLEPTTGASMKPGDKQELAVNLSRLYGFADQVALSLVVPDPSIGVKAPEVNVPKDQSTGKLMLEVGPKAKPGEHQALVRATLSFNGQQLQVEQPVMIKIDPPAP